MMKVGVSETLVQKSNLPRGDWTWTTVLDRDRELGLLGVSRIAEFLAYESLARIAEFLAYEVKSSQVKSLSLL